MAAPQLFARVEGPKLEEISDSWQAAPHRRAPSIALAPGSSRTAARTGLSAALSSVRLRRCEDFRRTSCFMTGHDSGTAPHVPGGCWASRACRPWWLHPMEPAGHQCAWHEGWLAFLWPKQASHEHLLFPGWTLHCLNPSQGQVWTSQESAGHPLDIQQ